MKKLLGFGFIALGIFLEITWLGICFGSVIIGILLLIFAPRVLFFPFTFSLVIGLSLILGDKFKKGKFNSANFKYANFNTNSQESYHSNYQQSYTTPQNDIDKYYETLESSRSDDLATIKINYKRLIKQYHYDTIASQNLSQTTQELYNKKTQELNEAYSAIKSYLK